MRNQQSDRNLKIYDEHKNGASYNDLATKYSLTKERIKQIITNIKRLNTDPESATSKLYRLMDNETRVVMTLLKGFGGDRTLKALIDMYNDDHDMMDLFKIKGLGPKGVSYVQKHIGDYMSIYARLDSYMGIYKSYYSRNLNMHDVSMYNLTETKISGILALMTNVFNNPKFKQNADYIELLCMLDMNVTAFNTIIGYFTMLQGNHVTNASAGLIHMYEADNNITELYNICGFNRVSDRYVLDFIKNCVQRYTELNPCYFNRVRQFAEANNII